MENQTKTLYEKLWAAKHEIKGVAKSKDNPFFKSKYADLNAILDAVEPILLKHELIILQPIIDHFVVTQIVDIKTGDCVHSRLQLPVVNDPQKQIAGVTYYRRATLQSLLSLQAVDDDGNEIAQTVKKRTLTDDEFTRACNAIDKGQYSIEALKNDYTLTESQLADLETWKNA